MPIDAALRRVSLHAVVRRFGLEPERVRLLKRGGNTHWSVATRRGRFVLRRYGADRAFDRSMASVRWEYEVLTALVACGYPALAPIGPPRELDGSIYAVFPYRRGRPWRFRRDEADYRQLGRLLADYHAVARTLPDRAQRPGWSSFLDGAYPMRGGAARRDALLAILAQIDPDASRLVGAAAREIEPRLADPGVRDLPMLPIHGDFSAWNLAFANGELSAVYDFDLSHLDLRAADLCFARRGHHDAVVRGYRERVALSAQEVEVLDALWTAAVLGVLWRSLELDSASTVKADLPWSVEQLVKTRPYRD